ncbi:hypothetical protein ACSZNR_19380, partial [Aeromonas caviae]
QVYYHRWTMVPLCSAQRRCRRELAVQTLVGRRDGKSAKRVPSGIDTALKNGASGSVFIGD